MVVLAMVALLVLVSIRRLHDRDMSGWWALPYFALPALFGPSADGSGRLFPGLPSAANAVLMVLSVGVSVWAFVDLGILRGATGPNRFGADPKGAVAAEVFD